MRRALHERISMPEASNRYTTQGAAFSQTPAEIEHLAAARAGDANHFSELAEPYRRELQAHCYRLLGSLHEAEDMVQETYLRAWKRLDSYEARATFRAWLYKIATNACLDALDKRRSRRLLPNRVGSASDPHAPIATASAEIAWLEPYPDEWLVDQGAVNPEARYAESESISLSFLAALQVLPPRQRAALILSDVLDFSSREVAELLGLTVPAVSSALHRARSTLNQNYHGGEPEGSLRSLSNERTRWLLERFAHAWESADIDGLVTLLKEDATLAMPPSSSWYQGRREIADFMVATLFANGDGMFSGKAAGRWRLLPVMANGSPSFGIYQRTAEGRYEAFGIEVLAGDRDGFSEIMTFIDPTLAAKFGLPLTLEG
jgi:RNA polymerase sigma-70 factor, ECF subfamily